MKAGGGRGLMRTSYCENTMIKKRYMHLSEVLVKENPNIATYNAPSLDARQDIVVVEVPKPGKRGGAEGDRGMGAAQIQDHPPHFLHHQRRRHARRRHARRRHAQLTKLLGLHPSVKRFMMYQITTISFRGPSESHLDNLVGQALFGDGAAAVIVGSDPVAGVELPLFQIVTAAQTILPDSEGGIDGHLRELGLMIHLGRDVPGLISKNIEKSLEEAFGPLVISDWNSIFWIAQYWIRWSRRWD